MSPAILRLRRLWFQVHKWIGISLAILIIPISLSGALLVWHDGLDRIANSERYAVSGTEATLPPGAYATAASAAVPGARLASLRMPEHEGPVVAGLTAPGDGSPVRTNVYLDPPTGRVLEAAGANQGLVRVLHVLHGSLMVPGVGRQIVGWVGVFMLLSCLTGIWLWWPVTGSVRRGFRWRRQPSTNANLHHLMGFWVLLPLAMLSFTGVWISFPQTFAALTGASQPGGGGPDRARRMRALPLERPQIQLDDAVQLARGAAAGRLVSISWPTDLSPSWTLSFERRGGPAEVKIEDSSKRVTPPSPPKPETTARTMRRWHDGTGMGIVWQVLIFLGGIIPCVLAVTGLLMWWQSRGWRAAAKRKPAPSAAPAE